MISCQRKEKFRQHTIGWEPVPRVTPTVEEIFFYMNSETDIYIEIHSSQRGFFRASFAA
jgi:hypothetical protein